MEENKFVLISPIRLIVDKKKYPLNLNHYKKTHYYLNNKAKKKYKLVMLQQIVKLPKFKKIKLEFILHKQTKRKMDRHNVCSIVEKFFCDALVELGKLPDDNDDFIESEMFSTGELCPKNEHIKIIISYST